MRHYFCASFADKVSSKHLVVKTMAHASPVTAAGVASIMTDHPIAHFSKSWHRDARNFNGLSNYSVAPG